MHTASNRKMNYGFTLTYFADFSQPFKGEIFHFGVESETRTFHMVNK